MARTGFRMMPTFPSSPLRFRRASFPQYGSKAGLSVGAFPSHSQVKPPPGVPSPCSGLHPTFASSVAAPNPRSMSRKPARSDAAIRAARAALPQGPSLRSGLFCPGPSTLNRPHPTHSWAPCDFPAVPTIRSVFAVRAIGRRSADLLRAAQGQIWPALTVEAADGRVWRSPWAFSLPQSSIKCLAPTRSTNVAPAGVKNSGTGRRGSKKPRFDHFRLGR